MVKWSVNLPPRNRDARTYRRLAAWARCHGYSRVTRHVVRKWTIAGLLPRATRVAIGWGAPSTAQRVETGHQLLRLCHYRYRENLGRLDVVAANLLLDGFVVDLDPVRRAMRWAHGAFTSEALRSLGPSRRNLKDRWLRRLAADPTAVAAMQGLDRLSRELLLYEAASMVIDRPPSRYARATLLKTTGTSTQRLDRLLPLLARPTNAEIERALHAPDDVLVTAAQLVTTYPELIAGVEKIRSARTRTIRRLVLFTALVRQVQTIAKVG